MEFNNHFTDLIKEHEGIIYKVTKIYTDNKEDENDLYQEIVFQIYKGLPSFKGQAKPSTWMYRVALNTAFYYLKKEKRRVPTTALDNLVVAYEGYDPVLEQQLEKMYAAIHKLKDVEKAIVVLYLEGKPYEEIGSILGFTANNIGTRMLRIKEKLKEKVRKK